MHRFFIVVIGMSLAFCLVAQGAEASESNSLYWPQWRGPHGTGSTEGNPPIEWSETKNIRWKIPIAGKGASTPIIWGDLLFITTAAPASEAPAAQAAEESGGRRGRLSEAPKSEMKFNVVAIDRTTGKTAWNKTLRTEMPHEGTHPTGTYASNSAVTDGEHLFAYFGSRGLYALDMKGNLLWEKDFGEMQIKMSFGEGSSPALLGDTLVLLWDHEGPSFIVAIDKRTGEELWKVDRDEKTSWSSPYIVEHNGIHQVITSATNRIRSYNLKDGSLIWETSGMTANAIPTPVSLDGTAILMSGFRGNALLAIRLDQAQGDISNSDAIAWKLDRDTPYTPSPLLYGEHLYIVKSNSGVLSCFNALNGEPYFGPERLEGVGTVYASPVGAADRVYITDREGSTLVIRHGNSLEVLAHNKLDDGFDASGVIVGNELYLRGQQNLYCIANDN